jgi:hypothetical protein
MCDVVVDDHGETCVGEDVDDGYENVQGTGSYEVFVGG